MTRLPIAVLTLLPLLSHEPQAAQPTVVELRSADPGLEMNLVVRGASDRQVIMAPYISTRPTEIHISTTARLLIPVGAVNVRIEALEPGREFHATIPLDQGRMEASGPTLELTRGEQEQGLSVRAARLRTISQ